MLGLFKSTCQGKSERPKSKIWWEWNRQQRKSTSRRAQRLARRQAQKMPWRGVTGGLVGTLAGVIAASILRKSMRYGRTKWARSGQAPDRSHIQIASHPAAQSRFRPPERQFEAR